jgi:hypothetical protein
VEQDSLSKIKVERYNFSKIWRWTKRIGGIAAVLATTGATIYGAYAAKQALSIYADTNFNARYDRLETRDREIAQLIVDQPELAQLYQYPAALPEGSESAIGKYLDRRLGDSNLVVPVFTSARDFSCKFWSDDFPLAVQNELMPHYFTAEYHTILLYDVWYGFRPTGGSSDPERDRVYRLYWSYVDEIGTDFLFLTSVFELARFGYYEQSFSHDLRKRILEDDDRLRVAQVYFPEFLSDDWWNSVVEAGVTDNGEFDPCAPIK